MSDTELIFLGTGNAFHDDGRGHQSLWIKASTINFLVDAGATSYCRMKELGLDPDNLDFIFITHFHGDHTAGLPFIMLYLQKELDPPHRPVFIGPEGLKERCSALFEAAYEGSELGKEVTFMELAPEIQKGIEITRDFSIDVYPMDHHPESLGYRFYIDNKIIAVSGDAAIDQNLVHLVHHVDAAVIECSTLEPVYPSHTSLAELIEYLPEFTARKIFPVHTTAEICNSIQQLGFERIVTVSDKQRVIV